MTNTRLHPNRDQDNAVPEGQQQQPQPQPQPQEENEEDQALERIKQLPLNKRRALAKHLANTDPAAFASAPSRKQRFGRRHRGQPRRLPRDPHNSATMFKVMAKSFSKSIKFQSETSREISNNGRADGMFKETMMPFYGLVPEECTKTIAEFETCDLHNPVRVLLRGSRYMALAIARAILLEWVPFEHYPKGDRFDNYNPYTIEIHLNSEITGQFPRDLRAALLRTYFSHCPRLPLEWELSIVNPICQSVWACLNCYIGHHADVSRQGLRSSVKSQGQKYTRAVMSLPSLESFTHFVHYFEETCGPRINKAIQKLAELVPKDSAVQLAAKTLGLPLPVSHEDHTKALEKPLKAEVDNLAKSVYNGSKSAKPPASRARNARRRLRKQATKLMALKKKKN